MEKHQFHVEKVHLLFDSVAMKKEIQVSLAWEGPDTYPVMKMRERKKRRLATSTNYHSKHVTTLENALDIEEFLITHGQKSELLVLRVLSTENFVHRDLHPCNLLVSEGDTSPLMSSQKLLLLMLKHGRNWS